MMGNTDNQIFSHVLGMVQFFGDNESKIILQLQKRTFKYLVVLINILLIDVFARIKIHS
jgi:hypothetical protein